MTHILCRDPLRLSGPTVSSIKVLEVDSETSPLRLGPGEQLMAATRITCIAMTNKICEIVHPIAILTWRSVHLVVNVEVAKRSGKSAKYFFNMAVI